MTNPAVLMIRAYTIWNLDDMEARYRLLKLWEAPGRDASVAAGAAEVGAIAHPWRAAPGRADAALPNLEIIACYRGP